MTVYGMHAMHGISAILGLHRMCVCTSFPEQSEIQPVQYVSNREVKKPTFESPDTFNNMGMKYTGMSNLCFFTGMKLCLDMP